MKTPSEKAEYMRAWRAANKDKTAEQNRAWYAANKDKRSESCRAWYAANKDKKAEYMQTAVRCGMLAQQQKAVFRE